MRKHAFATTGSTDFYSSGKERMSLGSKSKVGFKQSVDFLNSLPELPKIPEAKDQKVDPQKK